MLQYRIEITSLAEQDLERIGDYIAFQLQNPEAAVNMVQGIHRQISKLQGFPKKMSLTGIPSLLSGECG